MERRLANLISAGFFLFALTLLSSTPRSEFAILLILSFFAFVSWYFIIREEMSLWYLIVLALLGRTVFFFENPLLSDDFYRFIWDGNLMLDGVNPFGKIPHKMPVSGPRDAELIAKMNSPNYPSVYPPIHQLGFAFGAFFGNDAVNGMRLFIILCEALGLVYFLRFSKSLLPIYLFYLLNPLVLLEGIGNVHFEAALLPFLAVALAASKAQWRGVALALAVLVKLNPLILFPAVFRETPVKKPFVVIFTGILLAGFLSFVSEFEKALSGYDLYFRNFEFNASIYYLFSEIGKVWLGYNPIAFLGPLMGMAAFMLIMALAYRQVSLPEKALWSYLVFFIFSTTVHPWYVIPIVYLALLTNRQAILIWSFTVLFSYSHYLGEDSPKFGWLALEYLSLAGAVVYEYRFNKHRTFVAYRSS